MVTKKEKLTNMIDAKRIVRQFNEKKNYERDFLKIAFQQYEGFTSNGETFVAIRNGNDVVSIMKSVNANYCKGLGFHTPFEVKGLKMAMVKVDDVAEFDTKGRRWHYNWSKCQKVMGKIRKSDPEEAPLVGNGFVGEVGERINIKVMFVHSHTVPSDSDYGDFTMLQFRTEEGAILNWFQRSYNADTVQRFFRKFGDHGYCTLEGTVKLHEMYRGAKNTCMRNCVIVGKRGIVIHDYAMKLRKDMGDFVDELPPGNDTVCRMKGTSKGTSKGRNEQ